MRVNSHIDKKKTKFATLLKKVYQYHICTLWSDWGHDYQFTEEMRHYYMYTTLGELMSLVLCTGIHKKGSIQKFDQLSTISFFKCYVAVIIVMWNSLFHNTNVMFCVSDWMSFFTPLYVDYLDFHGIILLINLEVDTCSPAHNNWKFLWYQAL